jgi:colanic acid/amylovoran biosynthesis glycosyltransferase
VVTIHGADAYTLRSGFGAWLKRRVLRGAAAVLPVSGDIARTLDIEGAPVLRMGVDAAAVRAAVGGRRPEDGLLVYIGRLADKKGVDVLLDAVASLPTTRLEILGDGPDRGALEARAARLGLDERVRFRGRQPSSEVLAALARAQAVVIPSRVGADGDMEGTPVVLCEAMAAGVPVVASDLGGLGECIVDGETGLLVAPDDAAALTVALEKTLTDSVDIAEIGRAAADEASRTLDIGAVGAAYARVFDDVVEPR